MRKSSRKKDREIAVQEIKRLFKLAGEVSEKKPERANRYVEIALKISTRLKVTIPRSLKRSYCKDCKKFLIPGKNCRVRTKNKMIVQTCLNCNAIRRFKLKKS